MKKERMRFVCAVTAAICFGIVCYGNFYNNKMNLGLIFAFLCLAQIIIAIATVIKMRKNKDIDSNLNNYMRLHMSEREK